jgi:methionyl-tRNA formyltransferase
MKVVILGKGLMLANIILAAVDAGVKVAGVLRYEKTSANKFIQFFKDTFNPDYELTLIKRYSIKELNFKSANSVCFRDFLVRENIDIIFVGTWKEKIEKATFDIPTIGTINLHPSLLPKYRGPNPYLQTILHGEEYSGITMHLVDENYDTGAILSQEKIKIQPNDTSKELKERTVATARKLVAEFLTDLNYKIVTPISQSEKNATYFKNITGDEKMLDFSSQTSEDISRTIRALYPFMPTYITCGNKFFIVDPYNFKISDEIFSAKNSGDIIDKEAKEKSLTIICKDKKAICFKNLKLYGAKIFTKWYIKNIVKLDN